MTAPAVPVATPVSAGRRPKAGIDRWAGAVEFWLRAHTVLVYAFLYLPIFIVVLFSFNANRLATIWTGFSMHWYGDALADQVVQSALLNSFSVAAASLKKKITSGTMDNISDQSAW